MNWFTKKSDDRIKALEEKVRELQDEVVYLRGASTMRVGNDFYGSFGGYYPDRRPVMTAIQAVEKLMAHAGIEVKAVPAAPVSFQFEQAEFIRRDVEQAKE